MGLTGLQQTCLGIEPKQFEKKKKKINNDRAKMVKLIKDYKKRTWAFYGEDIPQSGKVEGLRK